MNRGEIRWYKFQHPDKRRPVLIIHRDDVIAHLGEITVAPVMSKIRNIPTEVFLSKEDGMKQDCVVNLDHIQTVSKGRIGPLITTLSETKMNLVGRAVRFALDLW